MQKIALKDQIYQSILAEIEYGKYSTDTIINEKDLTEKFAVSKTPVREALVRLCSEGIIENLPRYGYRLIPVTQNEIQELIEYRKVVEIEALRLSYNFIGPAEIEKFRGLGVIEQEAVEARNARLVWKENEKFHWELANLCPNRYFSKTIKDALSVGNRYANQYFSSIWAEEKSVDRSHAKIVDALEAGELEKAQEMLIYDIELMKAILL